MRKSSRVSLVLIGLAALGGCGDEKRRDIYATREDCLADWGNKPEECTPATDQKHRSAGYFYGPMYIPSGGASWFGGSGSGKATRSFGSSSSGGSRSVSRGGFGSSSRSSGG